MKAVYPGWVTASTFQFTSSCTHGWKSLKMITTTIQRKYNFYLVNTSNSNLLTKLLFVNCSVSCNARSRSMLLSMLWTLASSRLKTDQWTIACAPKCFSQKAFASAFVILKRPPEKVPSVKNTLSSLRIWLKTREYFESSLLIELFRIWCEEGSFFRILLKLKSWGKIE